MAEIKTLESGSVSIATSGGDITLSQADFTTLQGQLNRKLAGRTTTIGVEPSQVQRAFLLLSRDPQFKGAFEAGQRLKVQARSAGFRSTQEFVQASRFGLKQRQGLRIQPTKTPTALEIQRSQSIPTGVRGVTPTEFEARQTFFAGQTPLQAEISRQQPSLRQLREVTPMEVELRKSREEDGIERRREDASSFLLGGGPQTLQPVVEERQVDSFRRGFRDVLIDKETGKIILTVERVERPRSLLEGLNFDIQRQQAEITQRGDDGFKSQAIGFGLGVGASTIGTAQFFKDITFHTIRTTLESGRGIVAFAKDPRRTGAIIGKTIRTQPGFATGFVLGEVILFKGISASPRLVIKTSDLFRTKGLIKIPAESVIAPEFPKQAFPKIAKGETAGELLKEFLPSEQVGVTRLVGFTASPVPFPKETLAFKGISEFAGVFQAPKVSPRFLHISSEEKKLFTINLFDTLRPSVMKISPTEFELAKGVLPSQKTLTPQGKVLSQFLDPTQQGKSIIPFAKTEKESIIPVGTKLELVDKRFFFEFEGRKVPIFEFETVKSSDILKTTKDIQKAVSESSRGITQRGKFTSLDVIGSGRISRPTSEPTISRVTPSISSVVSPSVIGSVVSRTPISSPISRISVSGIIASPFVSGIITPTRTPPSRPSLRPPSRTPTITPPYRPTPYRPPFRLPTIKVPPPFRAITPFKSRQVKQQRRRGRFIVQVRRFGKFKSEGIGSFQDVFNLGRKKVEEELGATFRIISPSGKVTDLPKIPKFFKKIDPKFGTLLIEKKQFRIKPLGRSKEVSELAFFKRLKSKRGKNLLKKAVKGGNL